MRFVRDDWNNECSILKEGVDTFEDCEASCTDDEDCLQYAFDIHLLQCKTLNTVRLGEAAIESGLRSGWLFDRVEQWRNRLPPCHGESFIYPTEYT